MAEPMRSGNTIARFSYADDVRILGFERTISQSAAAAKREVDSLTDWAKENAVLFDDKKSEVIQFPGRKKEGFVGIVVNGNLINPSEHIRWLGVYLDPYLSFKHHVVTWCAKALKLAQFLRRVNSIMRGAASGALVTAIESCVVPVATFGAEVWLPGMTLPAAKGTVVPPTSHLCGLIDKVLHVALRAALLVWRTAKVVLYREGGIPPARVLLEGYRLRLAYRLNSLDNRHLQRWRACICPNIGTLKFKSKPRISKRPEIHVSRVQRAL